MILDSLDFFGVQFTIPDHRAVGFEHDLALRNVEIERPTLVAGAQHGAIGRVKRLKDFLRK